MGKETIHQKLANVQKDLVAPKGQYNKFGKYHYRSCEDIMEGLKLVIPEDCNVTVSDDIIQIGDRIYVKATACFNDGTGSVTCSASAREPLSQKGMNEAQITGSASSYARKYALNGLFAIDDTKDPDAQPPPAKKNCGDYIAEIDKCDSVACIDKWVADNWDKVKDDLSQRDVDKLASYGKQVKEVFAK